MADSASSPPSPRVVELSRHSLHCATPPAGVVDGVDADAPFRLGPLDETVLPFVPIANVFVYKHAEAQTDSQTQTQTQAQVQTIPLERLRLALERLLDYYPHLTGRLAFEPHSQTPRIERIGTGALLVEAQCDQPLDAFYEESRLLVTQLPSGGNALLAPFDSSMEGVCREPPLSVQHTRFACGSVALGIRVHHIVCDSAGYFQLARDLAELYRAIGQNHTADTHRVVQLSRPPCIRSFESDLTMDEQQLQDALAFKPLWLEFDETTADAATATAAPASEASSPPAPPPVVGRILRFSASELKAIKAEAKATSGAQTPVSTYAALTAHIWQCVYRARVQHAAQLQNVSISVAGAQMSHDFLHSVNVRALLGLPPRYFPNAVCCPIFTLSHEALAEGPLGPVAVSVSQAGRQQTRDVAVQTAHWLRAAQQAKRRTKMAFKWQGALLVSQWNKFDMYRGSAFDAPPVLVSPPFTPISSVDGLTYMLATEEQLQEPEGHTASNSSIDVSLALSQPLWAFLDKDANLRRWAHSSV